MAISSRCRTCRASWILIWDASSRRSPDGAEVSAEADTHPGRASGVAESCRAPGSSSPPGRAARTHSGMVAFGAMSSGEGATGGGGRTPAHGWRWHRPETAGW